MWFAAFEDFLANRAIEHFAHVLRAAEQERHRWHHRWRADVVHWRDVNARHGDRTDFGLLDRVLFVAQFAACKYRDAVFAVGQLPSSLPAQITPCCTGDSSIVKIVPKYSMLVLSCEIGPPDETCFDLSFRVRSPEIAVQLCPSS